MFVNQKNSNILEEKKTILLNSFGLFKNILYPNLSKEKNSFINLIFDLITSQLQIFIDLLNTDHYSEIFNIINNNSQNLSNKINDIFEISQNFTGKETHNTHFRTNSNIEEKMDKFAKTFCSSAEKENKIINNSNYYPKQKSKSIIKNILLNLKTEKQNLGRIKSSCHLKNGNKMKKENKIIDEISTDNNDLKTNTHSKIKKYDNIQSKVAAYINSSYNYLEVIKQEILTKNNNNSQRDTYKPTYNQTNRQDNKLKNSKKPVLDNELMIFTK